ncbi:hypothetical protein GOV04_05975 [Candidatus Woesearchaeota archaeon]|nr:hypothetical protein [Candidatus Woesearchaeota archaeon]
MKKEEFKKLDRIIEILEEKSDAELTEAFSPLLWFVNGFYNLLIPILKIFQIKRKTLIQILLVITLILIKFNQISINLAIGVLIIAVIIELLDKPKIRSFFSRFFKYKARKEHFFNELNDKNLLNIITFLELWASDAESFIKITEEFYKRKNLSANYRKKLIYGLQKLINKSEINIYLEWLLNDKNKSIQHEFSEKDIANLILIRKDKLSKYIIDSLVKNYETSKLIKTVLAFSQEDIRVNNYKNNVFEHYIEYINKNKVSLFFRNHDGIIKKIQKDIKKNKL